MAPKNKPDILAHEIMHAITKVLLGNKTPLSENTDELYAYYMQFLMKECLGK